MTALLSLTTLCLTLISTTDGANGSVQDGIPTDLSLSAAEQIFLVRGLDVLIAEAGERAAEGDLRTAGAHPNPNLGFTVFFGPTTQHDLLGGNLGDNKTNSTLGFSAGLSDNAAIEDILSGKHSLRIQAASKALAAARIGIDDVKRLELAQLREAYVTAVAAKLNAQSAEDSFGSYDRQAKLSQIKFDSGAVSGLDVSRIVQAQLESMQALDLARSGYQQSVASLLYLLGVRTSLPDIHLTTAIDYRPMQRLQGESLHSLYSAALQGRTDVRIAEQTLAQKEVVARQAKRARVPDIQLQLGYSEQCNTGTCSSAPTFNAGLQSNLPIFYQQQGEIQRTESDYTSAQKNLVKTQAQVMSDVSQAFAGHAASEKLVIRMESQLLAQAKKSRDLAQLLYSKGAASQLDFLDAQRAFVAATLEYHQDLASYWTSVYQLEQATGLSLKGQ